MNNRLKHLISKTLQYSNNKNWYKNSNKIIKKYYPYDYNMFIDILAITSPRTTVKRNTINAIRTIEYLKENNHLPNYSYGVANGQISNNLKKYVNDNTFSGKKTIQFTNSLKLINNSICIDTWMLKAFNINRLASTNKDIRFINSYVRQIADKLNMKTYEVQACLWCYAKKELNNTNHKEYYDFTYYLKQYFEQTKLEEFI